MITQQPLPVNVKFNYEVRPGCKVESRRLSINSFKPGILQFLHQGSYFYQKKQKKNFQNK